MKPVFFKRHAIKYNLVHELWQVTGPIVKSSWARSLLEACNIIDFWLDNPDFQASPKHESISKSRATTV
jgi:hypothetical protein